MEVNGREKDEHFCHYPRNRPTFCWCAETYTEVIQAMYQDIWRTNLFVKSLINKLVYRIHYENDNTRQKQRGNVCFRFSKSICPPKELSWNNVVFGWHACSFVIVWSTVKQLNIYVWSVKMHFLALTLKEKKALDLNVLSIFVDRFPNAMLNGDSNNLYFNKVCSLKKAYTQRHARKNDNWYKHCNWFFF